MNYIQFVTPSTRGIASNIRLQPVQAIKMISGSDSPNLLQVIGNRRISNVQKTQQNVQQQISSVEQSSSQQASPNQQITTPPQHSPQQVKFL